MNKLMLSIKALCSIERGGVRSGYQPAMKNGDKGFTLIELLVGILISGILLACLCTVFVSQQEAYSAQEQIMEMDENIRAALDLMTREIRLAGYKNSTSPFSGIITAIPNRIEILADLDQDGTTTGENEDITYAYDSGSRQIWRNNSGLPIADNITDLSFSYTLADGSVTGNVSGSNLANIRKITILITARTSYPDRATGLYRTITLSSDVTPRNLGI